MKNAHRIISLILSAALIFSALAVGVFADAAGYVKKSVAAYIYALDKAETIDCLFTDALPGEPFIDAYDFLRHVYINEYTISEDGGKISLTCEYGTMTADTVNDTVWIDDMYYFMFSGTNVEGTDLECDYLEGVDFISSSDDTSVLFDLGKYGFDIVADGGRAYFPLSVINSLFTDTYNGAVYANGNIYFMHAMEDEDYFDNGENYDKLTREASIARYMYNVICFTFDTFYGVPSNAVLADSIAKKGFDRTLSEYDDNTRAAKELLLSTDLIDYFAAMFYLFPYLDDGGHTFVIHEPLVASWQYPDSEFTKRFTEIMNAEEPASERDAMIVKVVNEYYLSFEADKPIYDGWDAGSMESVQSWYDDSIMLHREGNTAMFTFDGFDNEVLEPFKWSLDWAKQNGIVNFVLDLTTNGGGSTAVLEFLLAMMLSARTHSSIIEFVTRETVTGVRYTEVDRADLDLNGVFDERDDAVAYDFNFAILTSHMSFSCANTLPMLAKENGIAVIGERSGGGSCIVTEPVMCGGHYLFMSSNLKFVVESGADFDLGAELDFDLTESGADGSIDYTGLFDLSKIGELVSSYYETMRSGDGKGDANGDGYLNAKDVVAIMKFIVGIKLAVFDETRADFNGDGKLNSRDVVAVMKAIVGK